MAVRPSAWMDFHNQAGCVIVTLPRLSDNADLIYTYAKTCRTVCNSYAIWGLLASMRCMQSLAQMPVLRCQVSEAPCILTFLSVHTLDSLRPPIRPRRKTHSFPFPTSQLACWIPGTKSSHTPTLPGRAGDSFKASGNLHLKRRTGMATSTKPTFWELTPYKA